MRSYLIDEISADNMEMIEKHLIEKGFKGPLEHIFYIPFPHEMLNDEQQQHYETCGPYTLILETGRNWLKLELLVRGRGKLRCSCIQYCTPEQRQQMIDFLDNFIRELDIPV